MTSHRTHGLIELNVMNREDRNRIESIDLSSAKFPFNSLQRIGFSKIETYSSFRYMHILFLPKITKLIMYVPRNSYTYLTHFPVTFKLH